MAYILDGKILFDSEQSILQCLNGDEEVTLSAPAKRLLLTFVLHNGQVLNKEQLLKKVWEEHHFAPTEANLNNNLSILRKSFAKLDKTKSYINTVPKIGFRLDSLITESIGDSICESNSFSAGLISKKTSKTISKILLPSLYTTVSMAFLCFFIFYFVEPQLAKFKIGECKLYTKKSWSNDEVMRVKKILLDEKIDCKSAKDIFYEDNGFNSSREKISFVGVCIDNKKNDNTYVSCTTIRNIEGGSK